MRLAFDEATEVPAAELLDWIGWTIGRFTPYASAKSEIVGTVGFERTTGTGLVTFSANGRRDVLDQMLGLKAGIRVERFTFTSERFGIRARHPEIDVTDVLFELIAEGEEGTLSAEFPNGARHVVPAKVFDASIDHLHATRVATARLERAMGTTRWPTLFRGADGRGHAGGPELGHRRRSPTCAPIVARRQGPPSRRWGAPIAVSGCGYWRRRCDGTGSELPSVQSLIQIPPR